MKKTLLVTLEFLPQIGGIANYYSNICNNLDSDRVVVLAPKVNDLKDYDQSLKYKNMLS